MLELDDESKIIKNYKWLKKYVLGCKLSVHPTQSSLTTWRAMWPFVKFFDLLFMIQKSSKT